MEKTFVLDTNVLIQDPHALSKFGSENEVVIPLVVLNELDQHKEGYASSSVDARTAIRNLNKIRRSSDNQIHKATELPNGGMFRVGIEKPDMDLWLGDEKSKEDNEIIKYAKKLSESNDRDTILVTNDFNLQVRGSSVGVKTQSYQNSRISSDSSIFDNSKNTVHLPSDKIETLFKEGSVSFSEQKSENGEGNLDNNEGVIIKSVSNPSNHTIGRYKNGRIKSINKSDINDVFGLSPKNVEQRYAMDLLVDPTVECVCLSGKAGVGKTLLALAAGLEQCSHESTYNRMKVARPTQTVTKELGHLPGTLDEKLIHWFKPIYDNIKFLFRDSKLGKMNGRKAYEHIQDHTPIDTMSLAHIRGRSIPDAYILIDEAQNTTKHEMKTIISRAGKGSKIICTGDPYQIDRNHVDLYSNGLSFLIDRMQGLDLFGHVNLTKGERSELAEKATERL